MLTSVNVVSVYGLGSDSASSTEPENATRVPRSS